MEKKNYEGDLGVSRFSFWVSELSRGTLSGSFIAFLNPLMASPRDLPRSGSLLGPKTIKAITKITRSSGMPMLPNIGHPLKSISTLPPRVVDVNEREATRIGNVLGGIRDRTCLQNDGG